MFKEEKIDGENERNMYEDILGNRKNKTTNKIEFDLDRYKTIGPYCYSCQSPDVSLLNDNLTSTKYTQEYECNICGAVWREIWNSDLDLEKIEIL